MTKRIKYGGTILIIGGVLMIIVGILPIILGIKQENDEVLMMIAGVISIIAGALTTFRKIIFNEEHRNFK